MRFVGILLALAIGAQLGALLATWIGHDDVHPLLIDERRGTVDGLSLGASETAVRGALEG